MSEIKRKLASIRAILEIRSIANADNLELAIVDGWQSVVKKGIFKPGDLCIYFEIDSFLPIKPEFEFLRSSSYKKMGDKEGFALKTVKLRGQLSQGLIMSIDEIKQLFNLNQNFSVGDDLTDLLGIEKYEAVNTQPELFKGSIPDFIRKTDQERVQNIWEDIKDCKEEFEVSIKLDGTSCTYYIKDGVFGVCSRNMEFKENLDNMYFKVAKEISIEEFLRNNTHGNFAIQGELIGERIQGNHDKIIGQKFYVFDIWDIDNQCYLGSTYRQNMMKGNRFLHVPILCNMTLDSFKSIDDILKFADGSSINSTTREGLVFKSNNSDLSFKVISNQYLLKNDK